MAIPLLVVGGDTVDVGLEADLGVTEIRYDGQAAREAIGWYRRK